MSMIFFLAATGGLRPLSTLAIVILPIIALAGSALCIGQMRRHGSNPLGGVALMAWLLGGALAAITLLLRENLGRIGFGMMLLASGLLVAAGLVCGCIGAALHRRMGAAHGRAAAVWGIVLNTGLAAGGIAFFIADDARKSQAPEKDAAVPLQDAKSTKTVSLPDANCRLSYPDALWIQSGMPESIEKGATLALRCVNHDLMLALTTFHDEGDALFHAKSTRGRLNLNSPDIETTTTVPERIAGRDFWRFSGTGPIAKNQVSRTHTFWFTAHGGTIYAMHTMCAPSAEQAAMAETRKVIGTFALIDPEKEFVRPKPAPAATPKPAATPAAQPGAGDFFSALGTMIFPDRSGPAEHVFEDATSDVLGFSTAFGPLGWKSTSEMRNVIPGAPFTARQGLTFFLGFSVPNDAGSISLEELRTLFSGTESVMPQADYEAEAKPFKIPGAQEAFIISNERTINGIRARFRIIFAKNEKRAFYFQAWQPATAFSNERQMDEAIATIRLSADKEPLPLPRLDAERQLQSNILHKIGVLASQRGEWTRALAIFQSAYRISQHNDLTLASIVSCLDETGDPRSALDLLNAHADRVEKSTSVRAARARCRRLLGELDGACADFDRAFRDGHLDDGDMRIYLGCLLGQSKMTEAKKVADDFATKTGTARSRRLRAYIYASAGDTDGAMKQYEEILAKPPFDAVAALEYGEAANNAGKFDKAAMAAADLLKANNDGAQTRLIEGWSHFGRKEWREAKVSFEKARTFQPNNEDVAAGLLRTSAMLGEGDNTSVKNPLPENEIPPATLAEIEKIGREAKPPKGANAWSPMRVTVFTYRKGKPFSYTLHRKNRIVDQSAVSDFSTLNFPFDPLSQEIFVNRLVVTDAGGKVVEKGKPEEQYLVDQSSVGAEATHGKILRVIVPGVKPGRTVEFAVTVRERTNADEFPFQRNIVGTLHPVLAEAIVLRGDLGEVRAETSDSFAKLAKKTETKDTIAWLLREPPPWRIESLLPPTDDYMPVLSLGDIGADWKKEAQSYFKKIESLLVPDPEIRKLAGEIIAGLKTDAEKIRALTRHVQRNVTYQAIEFGRRARIPKAAPLSLASHYGDCKDQALLLHQLLSAAGIESHLALVNSNAPTVAALPSLDQFNHMIVRVPSLKTAFVDPTSSHLPAGVLAPEFFKHQALVLDPANPRLEALPARGQFPADHMGMEADISLSADGEMQVKETLRISGYHAFWLRTWLADVQPSDRLASVQRWLTNSRPQLHDVALDALDQDEAELVLKLQYTMPRAAMPGPAAAGISLPAVLERQFIVHSFLKERHQPFDVLHPISIDSRVALHTPKPPAADALRSFSRSGKTAFCKWDTNATQTAGKDAPVSFTFHFESTTGVFPASRYQEWQSACSGAVEAWQSPIKIE